MVSARFHNADASEGTCRPRPLRPDEFEVTGTGDTQPLQPTAMQDAQLSGRVEPLGAVNGVLGVGARQGPIWMLGPLECCAHEALCAAVVGNPAGSACSATGAGCSAEEVSGGGVGVWVPIKPSRRTPVATVLMRSSRMLMAPGSRRLCRRVDPIG